MHPTSPSGGSSSTRAPRCPDTLTRFVLEGEYTVGLDDEELTVSAGDSLFIPAGTVHWYRNESDEPGAFLCAVPNGDDEIQLLD